MGSRLTVEHRCRLLPATETGERPNSLLGAEHPTSGPNLDRSEAKDRRAPSPPIDSNQLRRSLLMPETVEVLSRTVCVRARHPMPLLRATMHQR